MTLKKNYSFFSSSFRSKLGGPAGIDPGFVRVQRICLTALKHIYNAWKPPFATSLNTYCGKGCWRLIGGRMPKDKHDISAIGYVLYLWE